MEQQYLVQKYIESQLSKKKETYAQITRELKQSEGELESVCNNIKKIEESEDIAFEIFSPRTGGNSLKGELNELYKVMRELESVILKLREKMEMEYKEVQEFEIMSKELSELTVKKRRGKNRRYR